MDSWTKQYESGLKPRESSLHAGERMIQRYVFEADIRSCGKTAKKLEFQSENSTWKVIGKGQDGDKIAVICAIKDGVLIVTVY